MGEGISELLKNSVGPLGGQATLKASMAALAPHGPRGHELAEILAEKNGWIACYSALLLRPLMDAAPVLGILSWNKPSLWKQNYPSLRNALFFAEDAFGNQFAIVGDRVQSFESETGEFEDLAGSIEEWAKLIHDESRFYTGWPLAFEWQEANGPLPLGQRLLPRIPFKLQGEYSVSNLYSGDDLEGMRFRGNLATQLKDVPDGTPFRFSVVDNKLQIGGD